MENSLSEILRENEQLKAENHAWSNQWKGYLAAKESAWEIRIPKPVVLKQGFITNFVGRVMTEDITKLYKIYLVVSIVCICLTALSEVYNNLSEYHE